MRAGRTAVKRHRLLSIIGIAAIVVVLVRAVQSAHFAGKSGGSSKLPVAAIESVVTKQHPLLELTTSVPLATVSGAADTSTTTVYDAVAAAAPAGMWIQCGEVSIDAAGVMVVQWRSPMATKCPLVGRGPRRSQPTAKAVDGDTANEPFFLSFASVDGGSNDAHAVSETKIIAHGESMKSLARSTIAATQDQYDTAVSHIEQEGFPDTVRQASTTNGDGSSVARALGSVASDGPHLPRMDFECGTRPVFIALLATTAQSRHDAANARDARWGTLLGCTGADAAVFDASVGNSGKASSRAAAYYVVSRFASALPVTVTNGCTVTEQYQDRPATSASSGLPLLSVAGCRIGTATRASGHSCADVLRGHRLQLHHAIKYGTKTGIYQGAFDGVATVVKQFNAAQYATFSGFRRLVSAGGLLPRVNIPTMTCFAPKVSDSVFQTQPLVKGVNLKKFLKTADKETVNWSVRFDIMLQIACIFRRLHEHPQGPFSFDDNHPEQYMITERIEDVNQQLRVAVTLIDIDTVQHATRQKAMSDGADVANNTITWKSTAKDEARYTTKCRCFYCRGRSNCMFINTPEGYAGCGQEHGEHANKEDLSAVLSGRRCHLGSDAWFLAQLFIYISDGAPPWQGVDHGDVLRRLGRGAFPKARDGRDPVFAELLVALFRDRITPAAAVTTLSLLCAKYECSSRDCPLA